MRVLLLSLYFAPDWSANSEVMTGLTEALVSLGHEFVVVTAFPHYDRNRIWDQYRWKLFEYEARDGLRIYRTYLYVPRKKQQMQGRLLNYLSFNMLATLFGWLAGRCDLVLAPSPPLTIGLTAYLLGRVRRVPYIYNVQDIYPDVAVRLGVLTNPRLIRFFQRMESFVYEKSSAVTVLSEGFRENLTAKGVPPDKVHVIPNFVDVNRIRPMPKQNGFGRRHGLDDKFVVLYAGNVGLSQGLETALIAAQRLADLPEFRLVIVGDGASKEKLEEMAKATGLGNVIFLPFQPRTDLAELYATANASLVSLRQGIGAESVPSKAYTILASALPVVASVDRASETARLIDVAKCGLWVEPEDADALAAAIRALHSDPVQAERMGENGRQYVVEHHTPEAVAKCYDVLFQQLTEQAVGPSTYGD